MSPSTVKASSKASLSWPSTSSLEERALWCRKDRDGPDDIFVACSHQRRCTASSARSSNMPPPLPRCITTPRIAPGSITSPSSTVILSLSIILRGERCRTETGPSKFNFRQRQVPPPLVASSTSTSTRSLSNRSGCCNQPINMSPPTKWSRHQLSASTSLSLQRRPLVASLQGKFQPACLTTNASVCRMALRCRGAGQLPRHPKTRIVAAPAAAGNAWRYGCGGNCRAPCC
mmetsp:Transcript_114114/g.227094  ORF Transcript_114114/g.227094 Transcript_114114/m.227094 type:complete len:231 (+) Transcript_114114:301-993(+)